MCDVSHPHSLSWYSAVPPIGSRGPVIALQLGSLRHGARGISAQANDAGRIVAGIRLALPPPLFPYIHLAQAAERLGRRADVSCRLLPLQAIQPAVAFPDQAQAGSEGLGAPGSAHQ